MSDTHVFVASGAACPLCEALAGLSVPAGYKPHDNCNCNTVKHKAGGECAIDYQEMEIWPTREGFRISLSLTITCPDGTVMEAPGATMRLESLRDGEEDSWLEGLADMHCNDLCEGAEEDDEFLCC